MKAADCQLLLASSFGWKTVRIRDGKPSFEPLDVPSDASPEQVAGAIANALESSGRRAREIVVALASEDCISTTIKAADLPHRGRRPAMLYRLEEKLPLAAEEISADFLVHDGQALAVCTRTPSIAEVLPCLRARRVNVAAVCPRPLLDLLGAQVTPAYSAILDTDAVLWQHGAHADLFILANRNPVAWISIPAERQDVELALATQVVLRRTTLRLAVVNISPALLDELKDLPDVDVAVEMDIPSDQPALIAAAEILRGRQSPPLDLRPSATGQHRIWHRIRTSFTAAAVAVLLLGCCILGGSLWRASQYAGLERQAESDKAALFRRLFPGQPLPVGIQSRLHSVARQLQRGTSAASPASTTDALVSLRQILLQLPSSSRFRLTELDVDSTKLLIIGEVSSHEDADAIAAALRRSSTLKIDEPQTQQLSGPAVQFSIAGSMTGGTR